jgi:hypothetical protein
MTSGIKKDLQLFNKIKMVTIEEIKENKTSGQDDSCQ